MTKQEILDLSRLDTDVQLDEAIDYLDDYLERYNSLGDKELQEMDKLSDLIYEYEERTDILNR